LGDAAVDLRFYLVIVAEEIVAFEKSPVDWCGKKRQHAADENE